MSAASPSSSSVLPTERVDTVRWPARRSSRRRCGLTERQGAIVGAAAQRLETCAEHSWLVYANSCLLIQRFEKVGHGRWRGRRLEAQARRFSLGRGIARPPALQCIDAAKKSIGTDVSHDRLRERGHMVQHVASGEIDPIREGDEVIQGDRLPGGGTRHLTGEASLLVWPATVRRWEHRPATGGRGRLRRAQLALVIVSPAVERYPAYGRGCSPQVHAVATSEGLPHFE